MAWDCDVCGEPVSPKKGPKGWWFYQDHCGARVNARPQSPLWLRIEKAMAGGSSAAPAMPQKPPEAGGA